MPSPSPSRREATHERILEVAARDVRRSGYAGIGVADVMKQAGLTHGGFYAHFESRDAMLAEAVERAGRDTSASLAKRIAARQAEGVGALRALVEIYLSEAHLAGTEFGCVVAALASKMPRQSAAVQAASAARVRGLVTLVRRALPAGAPKEQAMAVAGAMVGSLQLARALGPNAEGRAMLTAARQALLAQHDP